MDKKASLEAKAIRAAIKDEKPETILSKLRVEIDIRVRDLPDMGNFVDFYNRKNENSVPARWRETGPSSDSDILRVAWLLENRMMDDVGIVVPVHKLYELVHNWKCARKRRATSYEAATFVDFADRVARQCLPSNVVFLVLDLKKTSASNGTKVGDAPSRSDVESCLLDASMRGVRIWRVEGPVGLASFMFMMAKSLSTIPKNRRKKAEGFDWHTDQFNGAVAVNDSGVGLRNFWIKSLQMIRGVTPEIAGAVAANYPTMSALMKAYDECGSREQAENLLTDVFFSRGPEGLASSRRIGPAASKRIYALYSGRDPQNLI